MLLSSSNRKYPSFPLFSYFPMVVCLRCLLHHILSLIVYTFRKNREFVSLVLCSLWWVQIVGYVLACRSYSFVCTLHHLIIILVQTLSEDIELIKCLSDIVCQVWVRLSILSQLSITICGAVFSAYQFPLWYYPLFRVRSWNNGMRCMSFYIRMSRELPCGLLMSFKIAARVVPRLIHSDVLTRSAS